MSTNDEDIDEGGALVMKVMYSFMKGVWKERNVTNRNKCYISVYSTELSYKYSQNHVKLYYYSCVKLYLTINYKPYVVSIPTYVGRAMQQTY